MTQPPVPDQPPGNPSWLRLVVETNLALRAPLEDGAVRIRGIDPTHWTGAAYDGYVASRDEQAEQWRAVLEIHNGISNQVDGYNTFVHQLPHLWEEYRNSPDDLRHFNELHEAASTRLARALQEQAALLDNLPREPVQAPAPPSEPRPDPHPEPAEPASTGTDAAEEPTHMPPPAPHVVLEQRTREHEQLTAQMKDGIRLQRISWKRPLS